MAAHQPQPRFRARGFLFGDRVPLTDPDAYNDYVGRCWQGHELVADLGFGVLPVGLIVQADGGYAGVVEPDPDGGQRVRPLREVIDVGTR